VIAVTRNRTRGRKPLLGFAYESIW
jgi:hypothetical protein